MKAKLFIFVYFLSLFSLQTPLFAAESEEVTTDVPSAEPLMATLPNGLKYCVNEVAEEKDAKIIFTLSNTMTSALTDDALIPELLAYSLFFGTEHYDRAAIAELLIKCGQDISPQAHVRVYPNGTEIYFHIPSGDRIYTLDLLCLLSDMASSAHFTIESIELARKELISQAETLSIAINEEITDEKIHHLTTITPEQLQEHYQNNWRANLMSLTVDAFQPPLFIESFIYRLFYTIPTTDTPVATFDLVRGFEPSASAPNEPLPDIDHDTVVIDGKIYMAAPNWMQKQEYGRWFGAALGAVGFTCLIIALFVQPFVAIAGIASIAGGTYFVIDPYLTDPLIIQEKRKEDLNKGFLHAYIHGRAGCTLTPCERRTMFLNENLKYYDNQPKQLSDFPILHLGDIYNVDDSTFKPMLHHAESRDLQKLKSDFVLERNNFKYARYSLEEELISLLRPHQILRDIALDNARKKYESDPAVDTLRKLQAELGHQIDAIWDLWRQSKITDPERDRRIDSTENYYRELMNDEFLVAQVKRAREILELEQERILRNYAEAENNCKELMNYEARMKQIEKGLWGLYSRYNDFLMCYLHSMPLTDINTFPDYLDLRKQ